jgi:uncharacterized protein (DUF58 family)
LLLLLLLLVRLLLLLLLLLVLLLLIVGFVSLRRLRSVQRGPLRRGVHAGACPPARVPAAPVQARMPCVARVTTGPNLATAPVADPKRRPV